MNKHVLNFENWVHHAWKEKCQRELTHLNWFFGVFFFKTLITLQPVNQKGPVESSLSSPRLLATEFRHRKNDNLFITVIL